jgi:hypothetical protein
MAAYHKTKRSQKQEYRSFSSSDYPYTKEVRKANEWLEKVLENNQILNKRVLNKRDRFRLIQFFLAARRQLSSDKHERESLLSKLVWWGNEGLNLGLSLPEISATSRLAIELKAAGLLSEDFLKKVRTKIGAKY